MKLGAELIAFVKARRSGRIAGSDSGVLLEQDPDTVREPDIAFFSESKIPAGTRVRGYAEVVPDLVVEVVSPSNSNHEIYDKAAYVDQPRRTTRVGHLPRLKNRRNPQSRRPRNRAN